MCYKTNVDTKIHIKLGRKMDISYKEIFRDELIITLYK